MTTKIIHSAGKRKTAIARATLRPGKGIVMVNSLLLAHVEPKIARMKMQEPLVLAGDFAHKVNISVNVNGGGSISQAEAVRLALGRVLTEFAPELKETLMEYDRRMIVADVRRKETRKPNRAGKARAKVQKSYR